MTAAPENRRLDALPQLPEHFAKLPPIAKAAALQLVRGSTWAELLIELKPSRKQKARLIKLYPTIRDASYFWIGHIATQAGASRDWIIRELLTLYGRVSASVPVYDRAGKPTGEYRLDGSTAARCLELLGREQGMFGARAGGGSPADALAALLDAIAARGRPALPGRVLDVAPQLIAPQQERPESPALQVPDPVRD